MSNLVIKIENLSKRYQLGTIGYGSLQHDLMARWAKVRRKEDPFAKIGEKSRLDMHGEFWALREIDLEVQQGDRVGIVGRNGAGKSTLLKLLSRITSPTTGSIKVKGRIASLLEVGTGFHAELTGRENIFLNGAILGMKRREIQAKLEEIVAFSGVEQFVDTPVKRYSSGMYVRLAFAVAAHLDSEILIVDEVLAVGDAEFQKKCLGKMNNLSFDQGRTILIVSHQTNALSALCNKGVILRKGQIQTPVDDIGRILQEYNPATQSVVPFWNRADAEFDSTFLQPLHLSIHFENSPAVATSFRFPNDQQLSLDLEVNVLDRHPQLTIGIAVYDENDQTVFWSFTTDTTSESWPEVRLGSNIFRLQFPKRFLNEGRYRIELITSVYCTYWINAPQISAPSIGFEIQGGLSDSEFWKERRVGPVAPVLSWIRAN